jgi:hypothetical protein
MKINTVKLILLIVTYFSCNNLNAQTFDTSKILGKWVFERYEFLDTDADSSAMKKESKGLVLSFEKGQKFTTKMKIATVETTVGTGTYTMSTDGKYLYQNEEEAEILILNEKEFVMKVPDAVIMHFKRLK